MDTNKSTLSVITDPVTGRQFSRDTSVAGSIYSAYTPKTTSVNQNTPKAESNIPVVDGSKTGQSNLNIPTNRNNSKTDRANARINTAPEAPQTTTTFDDLTKKLVEAGGENADLVSQLLSEANNLTGGKFSKAGEDVLANLLGTQSRQRDRMKDTARLQEKAGLPELSSELASITGGYDIMEAAKNSRLVNETRGVTLSKNALSNRTSEIQRQYGLQVADNRINELVVTGKINAATQLIDAKLDLKYGDLEADLDLYKSQLEAITPFMNNEQSKLAEQRRFLIDQASNIITEARTKEKELELTKATALKNAYDRGASPLQIAQIQDAKSLAEVASTGFTTSLQERLQTQQLRESIANSQLQRQKMLEEVNTVGKVDPKVAQQVKTSSKQIDNALNATNIVAEAIEKNKGFKAAVGAGFKKALGILPFVSGDAIPGTKRADFETQVSRLKGALTLPALEQMKGLGSMSEVEFNTVASSVAALDTKMSESAFKAEVDRINTNLQISKARNQSQVDATNGINSVPVITPDGKAGVIPAEQIEEALSAGYQVIE